MKLLSEEVKPYGHLDYLPNPTQDFIAAMPQLQGVDIYIYFVLASNINDFINFKTKRVTPKVIAEQSGKSTYQFYKSRRRLKTTKLPFSGKPLIEQDRDMYIFWDFQHAQMIKHATAEQKRQEDLAKIADELLEKKAKKLGEVFTDEHGYPRNFHVNRLKNEVIEELKLDFDPWASEDNLS